MDRRPSHATTLLGLFEPGTQLEEALERCRALGITDRSLDVLSTLPLSEPHGHEPSRVPLHYWTLAGGVLGLVLGAAVATGTALLYPLKTGGISMIAPPVIGLIAFEGAMLLAILSTFLAMAWRITQTGEPVTEQKIEDGMIGLIIEFGDQSPPAAVVRNALLETGAKEVREL